jgi:hypothetical protein
MIIGEMKNTIPTRDQYTAGNAEVLHRPDEREGNAGIHGMAVYAEHSKTEVLGIKLARRTSCCRRQPTAAREGGRYA